MSYGVVLIYGPGTGLGKSTIASELVYRLIADGIPAHLVGEEDVMALPAFYRYVQQVKQGHAHDTETLLESCQTFARDLEQRVPEVAVVDSLLPCWDWLSTAGCSDSAIIAFTEVLSAYLCPLNPLLVFLIGNLEIGLARAIRDRGEEWALNLATERTGERSLDALRKYLINIRATAERMLFYWRYDVVKVDVTKPGLNTSVDQARAAFHA